MFCFFCFCFFKSYIKKKSEHEAAATSERASTELKKKKQSMDVYIQHGAEYAG